VAKLSLLAPGHIMLRISPTRSVILRHGSGGSFWPSGSTVALAGASVPSCLTRTGGRSCLGLLLFPECRNCSCKTELPAIKPPFYTWLSTGWPHSRWPTLRSQRTEVGVFTWTYLVRAHPQYSAAVLHVFRYFNGSTLGFKSVSQCFIWLKSSQLKW